MASSHSENKLNTIYLFMAMKGGFSPDVIIGLCRPLSNLPYQKGTEGLKINPYDSGSRSH